MDTNKFNDTFEGNTPHVAFIVFWYLHFDGVYKVKSISSHERWFGKCLKLMTRENMYLLQQDVAASVYVVNINDKHTLFLFSCFPSP